MIKIIRACTISRSIGFVTGLIPDLKEQGYEVIILSSPGNELKEVTSNYGIKSIPVVMERHISPFKDLKSLFKLIRVFKHERPSIVHSITPKAGMLCMVAAKIVGVPHRIHTFTGLVFPTSKGFKRKLLMLTDRITCFCANHIIPEGEGVKNDLLSNKITKKELHVLGFGNVKGVDMVRFSYRENVLHIVQQIKETDIFTFLFVGRIVEDKGINELVAAMNLLIKKHEKIRLILIGEYEDRLNPISKETKQLIDEQPAITTVGRKNEDELVAYYATADCFVFPSYREGFPNTVLEAGAMGLPSIVTNINGSREIIEEGKNGLIIPSHDADALYHAMETILINDGIRKEMASNARRMIEERYEQGFVRKCLYNFYKDITS